MLHADPPSGRDERLDQYLVRTGLAASRREAREMVASGRISLNGRPCKKGSLVHGGDRVEVEPAAEATSIEPDAARDLEILFEDAAVVVVNKPGGIPCHPLRSGELGTVMNAVVRRFPETASAGVKPLEGGLVHRLDNGTSGSLMIARTGRSFELLRDAIRSGRVRRQYLALVVGNVKASLELNVPIAHHPRSARRMVTAPDAVQADRLGARPASSRVEPLRQIGRFTLVSVVPQTGARHQIRVHLAHAGHPIVGDTLYGGPPTPELPASRFWLHLAEIEFDSPASGHARASSPLPPDLTLAMDHLAGRSSPAIDG